MSKSGVENAVQIATTLAILLGLALVVWELKQTRDLASAQLISDTLITREQSNLSSMGENPIATLSKTCFAKENLTGEEVRIASIYYQTKLLESIRK